jgi:hypothetical protein
MRRRRIALQRGGAQRRAADRIGQFSDAGIFAIVS